MGQDGNIWELKTVTVLEDFILAAFLAAKVKVFWDYQGDMCLIRLGRAPLDPVVSGNMRKDNC